ncbi:hypothetical protein CG433_11380 [Pantoea ananatis]|nr:hypothetical protein CG433_11380 [Pantoea ananatis]
MQRIGIEKPSGQLIHDFKHTFASHSMMYAASTPVLQRIFGHKDIKATMSYAYLAPGHLHDALKYNPLKIF